MASSLNILLVVIGIGGVLCQTTTTTPATTKSVTNATDAVTTKMTTTPTVAATNATVKSTTPMAAGNGTQAPTTTTTTPTTTVKPTPALAPNCTTDATCMYSQCDNSTKRCLCDSSIPAILAKVCGSNGVTYDNLQKLEYEACMYGKDVKKDSNGECDDKKKSNKKTVIIVIVIIILLAAIIIVGVLIYRRKRLAGSANVREEKSKDALL